MPRLSAPARITPIHGLTVAYNSHKLLEVLAGSSGDRWPCCPLEEGLFLALDQVSPGSTQLEWGKLHGQDCATLGSCPALPCEQNIFLEFNLNLPSCIMCACPG